MLRSAAAAAAVFAVFAPVWAASAHAEERIYSYEAASPAARRLAPTGLSFSFEKHLMGGERIHRIIQTGERGAADIKPAPQGALGDDVRAILADPHASGDLYEIMPAADGKAFVGAICPGAERAWLLIGPLERFRDLKVQAVGKAPGEAKARKCVALEFTFHGEWRLPVDRDSPAVRFPEERP